MCAFPGTQGVLRRPGILLLRSPSLLLYISPDFSLGPLLPSDICLLLTGWQDDGKIYSETFLGERFTGPHALLGYDVRGRADHDAILTPPGTDGHTASVLPVFLNVSRQLQAGSFGSGLIIAVFIFQSENQRSWSCVRLQRRKRGLYRQRRSVNERGGNDQGR